MIVYQVKTDMKKSKKIFIGISETSGFCGRLYCGLRQMGIDCFFAELSPNTYKYEHDNRWTKLCRNNYNKKIIIYNIVKFLIFIWALIKFDTFVFVGCQSFWNNKELWIYRILHKKTVMICLGSKTRLPYANGVEINVKTFMANRNINIASIIRKTHEKQKEIEIIEDSIDIFINLPAQAQLNKKKFISLSYIGLPIDFEISEERKEEKDVNKIKILHAASTVGCRGTKEFRQCITELQKKYDIEYIELSGESNYRVIEEIKHCDFILDELWSDTPLATFASEAAYYGKPAIVCGYFSEFYKQYYPKGSCPPSIYVRPENLNDALEEMICNIDLRNILGEKAKKYVRKYMNCEAVAKRFYKAINGNIDDIWVIDPLRIGYIEGYGIDRENQKEIIKKIYEKCGIEKMGISGNPSLTKRVMEIVNE